MNRFNSRLETAEEKTGELKKMSMEFIQKVWDREKQRELKTSQGLCSVLWDDIKQYNIGLNK